MAEQSFPALEAPMSNDQWKSVTLGIGDGILDEGGNPYRVELSNTNDTATVKVDTLKGFNHAILRGFYHMMDADKALSVPAVTTTRTYYIALRYDPTATVPITLGVWTSLDRSNGKYYLEIARIKRAPNQLLSNAEVTSLRPKITPVIRVDRFSDLPDAATVLWGTEALCWRENTRWRASWNGTWRPVGSQRIATWAPPGWTMGYSTWGILARPTDGGWDCSLTGGATRSGETFTITGWTTVGLVLPDAWRPATNQYLLGLYRNSVVGVQLDVNGRILIQPVGSSSLTIQNGYAVTFSFDWFVPVDPSSMS